MDTGRIKGDNTVLRGFVIATCIICTFVLGPKHLAIFGSYYDFFMNREIFQDYESWVIKENDNVGLFWKYMNLFAVLGYAATAIVLFFNRFHARTRSLSAALTDIIAYGLAMILIPLDYAICMVGSRSYKVDLHSAAFVFEALAFAFFTVAFVIYLVSFIRMRGHFDPGSLNIGKHLVFILIFILPCVFVIKAIKLSVDYAPNYGLFKVNSDEYDLNIDNMLYNYSHGAIEYDGALYINSKNEDGVTYSIDKLDADGNLTHLTDIDSWQYDIYDGKVYYPVETTDGMVFMYSIMSKDLETGETDVIYSDSLVDGSIKNTNESTQANVSVFKIKDGFLYYNILITGYYRTIYCFDLANDPYTRQLFVSDIRSIGSGPELTYEFLYNYKRVLYVQGRPCIYRGNTYYTLSSDALYNEDTQQYEVAYFIYESGHEELYSSYNIDGSSFYGDSFYLYNCETGDIIEFNITTEEASIIANVENTDPGSHHKIYIYGDHLLLKSDNMSVYIDI
ncbi:MAG: hypothetical protein K6F49_11950 [Saccharofermentans sp.]|nr:hypothetical protein [Saccharofermentans sp.]